MSSPKENTCDDGPVEDEQRDKAVVTSETKEEQSKEEEKQCSPAATPVSTSTKAPSVPTTTAIPTPTTEASTSTTSTSPTPMSPSVAKDPRFFPMNDKEVERLKELRSKTGNADIKSSDAALLRFLRARNLDVAKAYEMWEKWIKWRSEYAVDDIQAMSVANEIKSGKAYWHGYDREGRPCIIILPRRHFPRQRKTLAETLRFAVWSVERGVYLAESNGVSQFCVVYDRAGIGMVNRDASLFHLAKDLTGVLQDYYAERLGKLYILNVNWWFWLVYKVVSPLLSNETKAKIKIIRTSDDNPFPLLQYFDKRELQVRYGGTSTYEYNPREILGDDAFLVANTVLRTVHHDNVKVPARKTLTVEVEVTALMMEKAKHEYEEEMKKNLLHRYKDDSATEVDEDRSGADTKTEDESKDGIHTERMNVTEDQHRQNQPHMWRCGRGVMLTLNFKTKGHDLAYQVVFSRTSPEGDGADDQTVLFGGLDGDPTQSYSAALPGAASGDSDADTQAHSSVMQEMSRVNCHHDYLEMKYMTHDTGVFTVTFDNKFSYLRSKTLEYNIVLSTVRPADDEEIKRLEEEELSILKSETEESDEDFLKNMGVLAENESPENVHRLEAELDTVE